MSGDEVMKEPWCVALFPGPKRSFSHSDMYLGCWSVGGWQWRLRVTRSIVWHRYPLFQTTL